MEEAALAERLILYSYILYQLFKPIGLISLPPSMTEWLIGYSPE